MTLNDVASLCFILFHDDVPTHRLIVITKEDPPNLRNDDNRTFWMVYLPVRTEKSVSGALQQRKSCFSGQQRKQISDKAHIYKIYVFSLYLIVQFCISCVVVAKATKLYESVKCQIIDFQGFYRATNTPVGTDRHRYKQ